MHTYATPGVYSPSVTITNSCGNTSADVSPQQFVVVYDPSAGFVTGGGWITSPEEPSLPFMQTGGKAHFGFESKYQKGKTVPSGNTEFKFQAGGLDFRSTAYEWLVISGARAQYKGSGTVNGNGGYGFLLTAIDGQVSGGGGTDRFRIKIWEVGSGNPVYDNQAGTTDDAGLTGPGTALGGGSIMIHTPPGATKGGKALALSEPALQLHQNYPNPFTSSTRVSFEVTERGPAALKVYNLLGQEVATLFEGQAEVGKVYETTLEAGKLARGLYLYTLSSGGQKLTKRMVLEK